MKFDESKLTEKELAMERFVAHGKDELVAQSQCIKCNKNIGIDDCKIFGKKPDRYRFASQEKVCPLWVKNALD